MTGHAALRDRVARNGRWLQLEGLSRVIEEKDVSTASLRAAIERRRWQARHPDAGPPTLVWMVGLQRSGTNMLMRSLRAAPEFQVYNEGDRRAFRQFRLRSNVTIETLLTNTRAEFIALKPLCDSHRIRELLDHRPFGSGKALWVYRSVDGRVHSAASRFGPTARDALVEVARGSRPTPWQGLGLTPDALEFVRSLPISHLSIESAHALLWCLRNELYFDLRLHERGDVHLCSYDALVADPADEMRRICRFLGAHYRPTLVAHIEPRRPRDHALVVDPRVRERCDALAARLECRRQAQVTGLSGAA